MTSDLHTMLVVGGVVAFADDIARLIDPNKTAPIKQTLTDPATVAASVQSLNEIAGTTGAGWAAIYHQLRARWVGVVGPQPGTTQSQYPGAMEHGDLANLCRIFLADLPEPEFWPDANQDGRIVAVDVWVPEFFEAQDARALVASRLDFHAGDTGSGNLITGAGPHGVASSFETLATWKALERLVLATDEAFTVPATDTRAPMPGVGDAAAHAAKETVTTLGGAVVDLAVGALGSVGNGIVGLATSPIGAAVILGVVIWRYA